MNRFDIKFARDREDDKSTTPRWVNPNAIQCWVCGDRFEEFDSVITFHDQYSHRNYSHLTNMQDMYQHFIKENISVPETSTMSVEDVSTHSTHQDVMYLFKAHSVAMYLLISL